MILSPLLALTALGLNAQQAQPDVLDLVSDLQKCKKDGRQMKLVWWIYCPRHEKELMKN